eukprot:9503844-Pyramimonas_sp.AAC.2
MKLKERSGWGPKGMLCLGEACGRYSIWGRLGAGGRQAQVEIRLGSGRASSSTLPAYARLLLLQSFCPPTAFSSPISPIAFSPFSSLCSSSIPFPLALRFLFLLLAPPRKGVGSAGAGVRGLPLRWGRSGPRRNEGAEVLAARRGGACKGGLGARAVE